MKKTAMSLVVLASMLTLAGTALAGDVVYATVTGHEAFSEDGNHPEYWGEDCVKDESMDGELTFVLPIDFEGTAIVKAGADEFAFTIFEGATGGETVFADTNGNFEYDPDGPGGDKEISHVTLCVVTTETDTPTEKPTDTPTDVPTDEPTNPPAGGGHTPPPTDTVEGVAAPANGVPILLLALGLLLGSLVILKPGKLR